jgi:thiamine-phosphate pyrophosphorylase
MSTVLDRFYPVVPSSTWVARIVPLGARLVQLRIKDEPPESIRRQVHDSQLLCQQHGAQLVVNDYWQICLDEGCNFVHLGQGDLDDADIPALKRASVRLGVSTHDHAELDRALSLQPDYIALGPIYETLLKQMPWAPQGLDKLKLWKRLIGDIPLVAIGGLTIIRLPGVFDAGADSAAVVTDIVRSDDPVEKVRRWIAATRPGS